MLPTELRGARTHNLAGLDLRLEPGQVIVVSGVSGAGKSSLAMDTLYAEGQRRFVESFSPYARQFLERLERPPITSLDPVPAGIAVDRRAPVKSSRSTVATMADIEPYLAALFVREAVPICPEHRVPARSLRAEVVAREVLSELAGQRALVSYPLRAHGGVEGYLELREQLAKDGYRRLSIAGEIEDIDRVKPSTVLAAGGLLDVIVDRVQLSPRDEKRVASAVEEAWRRGAGVARLQVGQAIRVLRRGLACPECARALEPPRAGLFSYESPVGACPECRGFGRTIGIDLEKVIPDPRRTLKQRAVRPWAGKSTTWERSELGKLCRRHGIPMDVPWSELKKSQQALIISGDGSWNDGFFPGVLGWFRWLETRTYKMHVRVLLARYRAYDVCTRCQGRRLSDAALAYHVAGRDIAELHSLEIGEACRVLGQVETRTGQGELARRELVSRLGYLERVGLGYLTLDRQARTLSGGEAQRVTLTAALGTSLHNALFVLDEPTVGLHPSDVGSLTAIFRELAQRHNTVLVVEHDPSVILAADRVIELGPGAGAAGGQIVFDGTPAEALALGGATARAIALPTEKSRRVRKPTGFLRVRGARANNLRGIDVELPLGVLGAVTGVSGSGKSTLAVDVVYRALARRLGALDVEAPGDHDGIDGAEVIKRIALVDQAPLGRTSRGNAATYTKAWDSVRALFAAQPDAHARRLTAAHFSFNVQGGRCDTCAGEGFETVEMQFLADVRLVCPVCRGRRFKDEVLRVRHRERTISEVLELTVDEALDHFTEVAIKRALGPVKKLGLGYLRLGQPLSTLSGGEAQRLKLARSLADEHAGALLILDEPSAGLHADEVRAVLSALDVIVDAGGSVLCVEHDLDLIERADYVVDLGPGAGKNGGLVVGTGTPNELRSHDTPTGHAMAAHGRAPARVAGAPAVEAERALVVECAREHNLREVSVKIPHGELTVVTGPSGSGKSTLAFDVIFAEGQRRFLETLTPYARQFLPTMPRPDVDRVSGVPPSIALEQRTQRAGGLSTVATVTEVAHYLRLLYAKLGTPHCPDHDEPIALARPDAVFGLACREKSGFELLAPVVRARKGLYLDVFTAAARAGIEHAYCDGERVSTDEPPRLTKTREHTIDLVMARVPRPRDLSREQFDRALAWGNGAVKLRWGAAREKLLSTQSACPRCGFSVPELDPRWFSFNTAQGRCASCEGAGFVEEKTSKRRRKKPLPPPTFVPCPECHGARLSPLPRAVRVEGARYHEVVGLPVVRSLALVKGWRFSGDARKVAGPVVTELVRRLEFLMEVGLDYLSLDRRASTLSGGEMQRLRLAAQLGTGLTGALYVLDEPTIGLHPRDTLRLLGNLKKLVSIGSTVLVVEHDADTIRAADYLVDLGPGGGARGGRIMAAGVPSEVLCNEQSPTARVFAAPMEIRPAIGIGSEVPRLKLSGAREHNLKDVELSLPHARLTVVCGVSGSGKSTLVQKVLLPALRAKLELATETVGAHRSLSGVGAIARAVAVDQAPIGRTPRSVPATFLGIWDEIRRIFAGTPDAQVAGFSASRFSFNTPNGGRCPTCAGQGVITHEMSFLPDVVAPCPDCGGKRFEPLTLDVKYSRMSIGDVLDLTAEEAALFFVNHPNIAGPLRTLVDLGAGYIHLGQGSHTLSGGEAQRLKLSAELTATVRHLPTLYVLDEPTTGLHLADVSKLVRVLSRLVERGDTLVVIEHHPVVIAGADWVVELGPDGGDRGGKIVAEGPPAKIARRKTATGAVLRDLFDQERPSGARSRRDSLITRSMNPL
ncbi:MAG: excinuclease ABC subunit UvrA [Myxococcales bacterium]|nr:excinuclease ABC subunit UvrA [Myxococcales bacterium]